MKSSVELISVILLYVILIIFLIYPLFLKKMWNVDEINDDSIKKLKKILSRWIGLAIIAIVLLEIIVIINMT